MSESSPIHEESAKVEVPFSQQELKSFVADDQQAGRAICTMLSWFFFYTVVIMAAMTFITYRWVANS